jgi:hypothetical protein
VKSELSRVKMEQDKLKAGVNKQDTGTCMLPDLHACV